MRTPFPSKADLPLKEGERIKKNYHMNTKNFLNKKDIISILMMIFCLFMVKLFPEKDYFQKLIVSLTFLLAVPALYIKIALKEDLKNFGWRAGNWKRGITWIFLSLAGAFLILTLLYQYAGLAEKYYVPQNIIQNFGLFVFYETVIAGFFLILYEFFFRGFIMFSFLKKWKTASIILQFSAFLLFLIITKDFNWGSVNYIIASFFSGIVIYKSRSLLYSYLFSLLFVIISDAVYINSLVN